MLLFSENDIMAFRNKLGLFSANDHIFIFFTWLQQSKSFLLFLQGGVMHPYLLQPARPGGYHDYLRIIEQRRTVGDNNRGASKSCIERNTFPHKFTKIQREKNEDGEDDVEKCTICLCGIFFNFVENNTRWFVYKNCQENGLVYCFGIWWKILIPIV